MVAQAQAAAGHEVFATSLTREPQPAGHRAGVATRPLPSRNPLWIADSANYPAPVRLANKVATIFNFRTAGQFGALLDDVRPDVLHTHSMVELPASVWDVARRRGIPIVHTLHDYDLLCVRAALFKDGRKCEPRHLACRVLSAAKHGPHRSIDLVAAVSQTVLDKHLEHGLFTHLPPERRHVAWNPVRFDAPTAPRTGRQPGAAFRFGYLGRVVEEKGVAALIAACRLLPAQGWSLTIAGEGPDRARFESLAHGLPITFAGQVDAASFLAGIDTLVCLPLWDEPFGLTTLEAYAAGCRVIGTTQGVIGQFVARVDPGWTVVPGDVAALAATMIRAIEADTTQNASILNSTNRLLQELQPNIVAARYIVYYEQLLASAA